MPNTIVIRRTENKLTAEVTRPYGLGYEDHYRMFSSRTFRGAISNLPQELQFLNHLDQRDHYVFVLFHRMNADASLSIPLRLVCLSHSHAACADYLARRMQNIQGIADVGGETEVPMIGDRDGLELDRLRERVRQGSRGTAGTGNPDCIPDGQGSSALESVALTILCVVGAVALLCLFGWLAFKYLWWVGYWSR